MAQQQSSNAPKKRGGLWFLLIPILLIAALIFFKNKRSGNANTEKILPGITAQYRFTPEELINLVEVFDIDNIAGVCVKKRFIQFKHENASNYGLCNNYSLINITANLSDYEKQNEAKCRESMNENINLWDNEKTIEYTFMSGQNYDAFIESLKKVPVSQYSGEKYRGYENKEHYVKNNVIIIPQGYDINSKNFGLLMTRIEEISRVNKKIVQDSITEQKRIESNRLDSITKSKYESGNTITVKVNSASVYSEPSDAFPICTVHKGYQLIAVDSNAIYFLCDFKCDDKPATGWINRINVMRK